MSNAGQAALIVVGTVVGYEVGYPQLGFVLGSLAGSALFPTQLPDGPQIGDNRTTTSSIGDPVSIVFGTADVAGTVMWLAPYVQSTSGKGGPSQLTYNYNQSIAIGLCEGPIGGVSRIWENGAIVYDIRPQLAANADLNRLAETDQEYAARQAASSTYAETFVLYLGGETQEADPTIESIQGVGAVPAFRGLAYIVYPNRLLQTSQAWRHPNFKFEVYQAGAGDCTTVTKLSQSVLYPWGAGETKNPVNPLNTNTYHIEGGENAFTSTLGYNYDNASYSSFAEIWAMNEALLGVQQRTVMGYAVGPGLQPQNLAQAGGPAIGSQYVSPDPTAVMVYFNINEAPASYSAGFPGGGDPRMSDEGYILWAAAAVYYIGGPTSMSVPVPAPPLPWLHSGQNLGYGWPNWWWYTNDLAIQVIRTPSKPPPAGAGLPLWSEDPSYALQPDGTLVLNTNWAEASAGNYKVLQPWSGADGDAINAVLTLYPLGPVLAVGDAQDTEAFWTAAYEAAVTEGAMAAGKNYPGDYPAIVNTSNTPIWTLDYTVCVGAGAQTTVASIIAAVCARAGLSAIDVSDLTGISIDGYSISTVTSGTSIITPLRSVAFFDAIESNGVLKFSSRGKASVATFTADDFGAYDASGSGAKTVPPSIETSRAQDEDLPRSIRLRYRATALDYQDSEQLSPYRLQSTAVNDVDVSLPICMSDTLALQCAEVLWADSWAARVAYSLAVDQAWLALDCGDCIDVPVDSVLQRIRIVSDSNASGVLRKLSCVRDDGDAFVSTAVAQPILQRPQTLTLLAPTSYELLDLPALQDADNDPGFYVAAQRQLGIGSGWHGCLVYESSDGGATFAQLFAIGAEATSGTLAAAVPASQALTWDSSTTITVNVPDDFSFESITDAAVIAGGNAAAVGADGRWEVLQFATATQVSATQWALSRLLRGRRGTEHVLGSSVSGDAFVLLSPTALERVVLQTGAIASSRIYKAVSIGATYASGIDTTFAGHAQALLPFSPVALAAAAHSSGDILLSWIRRDRLGRTLMSGVDIPNSEASLAFQVDIISPSTALVLRTLSISNATQVLYTAAMQTADFGASGARLPAYVQQAWNSTTNDATTTVSTASGGAEATPFPAANTAGNLIVYAASYDPSGSGTGEPTVTIEDTRGNSFTKVASVFVAGADTYTEIGIAKNIAAGANAITATFSGALGTGYYKALAAIELSGLDLSSPLTAGEFAGQVVTAAASTAFNSGETPALAETDGFLVGFATQVHNLNGAPAAGSGASAAGSGLWSYGFGGTFARFVTQQLTAAAAVAANFEANSSGFNGAALAVVLKPAAAAAALSSLHVNVYQMSAVVGRGTPGSATLAIAPAA